VDFRGQTLLHFLRNQQTHSRRVPWKKKERKKKRLVIHLFLFVFDRLLKKHSCQFSKDQLRQGQPLSKLFLKEKKALFQTLWECYKTEPEKVFLFPRALFTFLLPILQKVKGWTSRKPCLFKNVPQLGLVLGCWLDNSLEFINAKKKKYGTRTFSRAVTSNCTYKGRILYLWFYICVYQ